ncbi:MAG: glycerol-3-phosphate dehydrogenase/oxidase [Bifidobacteriaceae bacterium]|jgi:glycerol-3-phosphate dehydrogenase|nr:glycerol-3-phosphate dehydrogenase/oxidase [Bifidobacteriaceae bacterium]
MDHSALSPAGRERALAVMAERELDVLVIGGGVTGAGIAVDAVTRGLTTGIVEAQDWAAGTSSRSSKLAHGGLRYLLMLDFKLVHEALTERDRLLSTTAPHLVKPVPFLYPLTHRVWERPYVATGVGLYDLLAHTPGRRRALPIQRHYFGRELRRVFPDLKPSAAVGAVRYFDSEVDDARLTLTLVRTAARYGAHAASRAEVTAITRNRLGKVDGAVVKDLLSGRSVRVKAKHVIGATGVWTEQTEALTGQGGGLKVLASKGAHIVVPKDRIDGQMGIISRTEKSVLFIIPWDRYWLIGTTDTPWRQATLDHPVATSADVEYLLGQANKLLARPLGKADVIGFYAGLRPLLQPGTKQGTSSAKISREHTVASPVPGLTMIAGGKLTTYRVMAKDAVDFALGKGAAAAKPSITKHLPLLGAEGYDAVRNNAPKLASRYGWDRTRTLHLLGRYGSRVADITDLIDSDPSLAEPIPGGEHYLKAEAVYAATHEGVIHLDDVMMSRTRLNHEVPDAGLAASSVIARLVAPHLGWDQARIEAEVAGYAARVEAERAAARLATDAEAEAARLQAQELTPMEDLGPEIAAAKAEEQERADLAATGQREDAPAGPAGLGADVGANPGDGAGDGGGTASGAESGDGFGAPVAGGADAGASPGESGRGGGRTASGAGKNAKRGGAG